MPGCPDCGGVLIRKKRNPAQRLVFRCVYRCSECRRGVSQPRSFLTVFHRYCECPRCGTTDVVRREQKDRIDGVSPNPLRRMLKLIGCPLYHCTFCRMQFRDWRNLAPEVRRARHAFSD
jgi:DNA-directed RNA polymerase subunit RPC12/RpoP